MQRRTFVKSMAASSLLALGTTSCLVIGKIITTSLGKSAYVVVGVGGVVKK